MIDINVIAGIVEPQWHVRVMLGWPWTCHNMWCMAGSTRTQTAIALGAALKSTREERGISQRKLSELIGRASGLVSRWESGERTAKPEDVAEIIEALGIEGDEAADLMAVANGAGHAQWLAVTLPERRQQLAALLAAERTATKVTHVAPLLIPGVLQTSDFIRSMMTEGDVPVDEIDERVAMRIGRRDLITRRDPARLDVLLDEAAIRRIVGSRQIMADQLRYLLEMSDLPNVEIRVVPFSAGFTPALTGSYILLDSDEAPSIVSLEMQRSGLILHDADDVAGYRRAAETVREKAMSIEATRELITDLLTEMETK
ncbi:helix-turn-helix domain-containing protein [Amycolatopsis sp. H20-H5]|uniref:helix-turn-helix domain-containing protein n=1 Tax=Amycolatopsis sp. H20-H5 TaxID=3046309 RepID=UPI002DBB612E|nr:helix-turn-helix transcriptional regulator [Amycolatopsis sp. H20-H5]MEC3979428.1 helix-turn-helix transcriptional regulator [Amycolatopsis sp. H20-H5]